MTIDAARLVTLLGREVQIANVRRGTLIELAESANKWLRSSLHDFDHGGVVGRDGALECVARFSTQLRGWLGQIETMNQQMARLHRLMAGAGVEWPEGVEVEVLPKLDQDRRARDGL